MVMSNSFNSPSLKTTGRSHFTIQMECDKPTHILSATLQANPQEYRYEWTSIASKDSFYWLSLSQDDPNAQNDSIELPEGEYIIIAHFSKLDPNVLYMQGGQVLVVFQINLSEDTTITLDPTTATNHVTTLSYTPDGESPKLPVYHSLSGGEVEVEPGNVNYLAIRTSLIHKELGLYTIGHSAEYEWASEDGEFPNSNIFKASEIWINDISDDIALTQFQIASTDNNGFYYTEMTPLWGITESVEGKYSKEYLKPYTLHSTLSIAGEKSVKKGLERSYTCMAYILQPQVRHLNCSFEVTAYSKTPTLWVAGINQLEKPYETLLSIQFSDYQEILSSTSEPGELMLSYYTRTMPLRFNSDKSVETIYTPQTGDYQREFGKENWRFIESPALSYDNNQCHQIPGDSQPTISFLSYQDYDWEEEQEVWRLAAVPYGRLGELRAGDTVFMDYSESQEIDNGAELTTMGVSVSNQIVDGIRGVTTASFTLDTEKTIAPPVLRQMQFRNTDRIVTDRFDSAKDGCFLISTATYTQQSEPEQSWNWWYDVTQCSTKVSVSPYGEQKWIEVELTELTDDYVAAFGNLYSGSLASVESESANGWYDMKIELQSAYDATSSQIISPAFKIGEGATINKDISDGLQLVILDKRAFVPGNPDALIVAYTLDGRLVASRNGNLPLNELPIGVYILQSEGKKIKAVIH